MNMTRKYREVVTFIGLLDTKTSSTIWKKARIRCSMLTYLKNSTNFTTIGKIYWAASTNMVLNAVLGTN